MEFKHTPVLLKEALDALQVQEGKKYIDATLGGGGHAKEIIKQGGIVLGIDQDADAIKYIESRIKNHELGFEKGKLTVVQGNFEDIKITAEENRFINVSGILFDLGVSSYQIGQSGRGFSFREDVPLDMRMGDSDMTAADIVNTWTREALDDLFSRYGEEENSRKLAQKIVEYREKKPIATSQELGELIKKIVPTHGPIHPATRVFQALRIQVNREMDVLKKGLAEGFMILDEGGRIAVISFHSLEDRIVKNMFREWENTGVAHIITKKPITARDQEVRENPRSRSAKMRVIKKV